MELIKKGDLIILSGDKKEITFNDQKINIDGLDINFPGEYEKSAIMAHVIEKDKKLLYEIRFGDKKIAYINQDYLEITEDLVDFFGEIDILLIKGSKNSIKTFENLEAKYVVPFGEQKDIFLSTLGQHPEEISSIKIKSEIGENEVVFVNLV